jgi:hypothetical protein
MHADSITLLPTKQHKRKQQQEGWGCCCVKEVVLLLDKSLVHQLLVHIYADSIIRPAIQTAATQTNCTVMLECFVVQFL